MTDYLDTLSDFSATISYEGLSPTARAAAKDVVMDTLGAILSGSTLAENANLARFAATHTNGGPSTILGHPLQSLSTMAALVNATAGVSQEMDEGSRLGGGHPSIHVLPGLLAVAEEMDVSGQRFLEAMVAGYEVCSRLGGATVPHWNVHSHGIWGTPGTAAAVARLMDLSPQDMRQVISLSASMSPANSWTPCFEGATVRNLYPGRSGMQGILAVHAQRCGFTAIADGPTDVYSTILAESFDGQQAVSGLGSDPLRIEQNYFKFHACCLHNHAPLDAVGALASNERIAARDVDWIKVTTNPMGERLAGDYPDTMLSAKFHIPYAVAASLVKGRTDLSAFEPDAIADPEIQQLAQRVTLDSDPEMNNRRNDYPSTRVSIGLKDGRTVSQSATSHHGDYLNPRPHEELVDKYLRLSTLAISESNAQEALSHVRRLEELPNLRTLTSLLSPH